MLQNNLLYIVSKNIYCVIEREGMRCERGETHWIYVYVDERQEEMLAKKRKCWYVQKHTLPLKCVCVC